MRKFPLLLVMMIAGVVALTSCEKGATLYDVSITVFYPEGYGTEKVASQEITVKNTLTGIEITATTDATGVAQTELEEGMYTIQATLETDDFYFNGITENLTVNTSAVNNWEIHMIASSKAGGTGAQGDLLHRFQD